MGYTHYWDTYGWDSLQWQMAWPKLIDDARLILAAADVLVSGPDGGPDEITAPLTDVDKGILLNGVADDSHEPFRIGPSDRSAFCKTLQKPYDLVVASILLRASDGEWDQKEWMDARRLYKALWPDEVVWCPWEGPPRDENGNYAGEDGRPHFGFWAMYFDFAGEYHGPEKWLVTEDGEKLTPRDWLHSMSISGQQDGLGKGADEEAAFSNLEKMMDLIKLEFPGPAEPETVTTTVAGLDLAPIKQWLSQCDKDDSHANCKASAIEWTELPGIHFRLIDTKRKCIIDTGGEDVPPFVALSYVWGGDQLKLTSSTAALLKGEAGLDKVWASIPTTIRDAILVCEELGERYLWVDALCIMQDSVKDKKLQVLRMRQIYASAKCTIASVSGTAAKEGLLPPKANGSNATECKSEAELDELLDKAPWSTRAWCYQEKVLSHRMIFFTTLGIYLQCQGGTFGSRGALLPPRPGGSGREFDQVGAMLVPSSSSADDLESYLSAVEYFSQRKLTIKDDKMNAFQGVLQRYRGSMDGQDSSFSFGLPICAFDQTFCWRTTRHDPAARNDSFPSWSWLGWDEPVAFDREMVKHARTSQMIYHENNANSNPEWHRVRKPANASIIVSQRSFGFPASSNPLFYNAPSRSLAASMADLRIGKSPIDTNGSNGLYPVYGMKCSQQPPPPIDAQPKVMTLADFFMMPMPEIKWMDDETAAAPSRPAEKQTSKEYDVGEHAGHHDCEAQVPLGHIWLDETWREGQPENCVMEFMAIHGEKEERSDGDDHIREGVDGDQGGTDEDGKHDGDRWTITMLMLTQRMAKKGSFWANERVQVMDCRLTEEEWARTGADQKDIKMVALLVPFVTMLTKTTRVFARHGELDLECDILEAPDYPAESPVFLFFHSGGLVGGAKERVPPWLVQACFRRKWPLISAAYRFLPQALTAGLLEDVTAAYEFAKSWKPESRGVVLGGASAGFFMATLVVHHNLAPPPLALLSITGITTHQHEFFRSSVLLTPEPIPEAAVAGHLDPSGPIVVGKGAPDDPVVFTLDKLTPDGAKNPAYTAPVQAPLDPYRRGCLYEYYLHRNAFPALVADIDPGFESASTSGRSWPPTVIIQGDDDYSVSMDVSVHMRDMLGEDRVKLFLAKGQGHLFEAASWWEDDGAGMDAVREAIAALDTIVGEH
ncbi:uncharacterized protein DNG_04208 [Cephalotrichum gorgonifer]|uniref:Heterokaryon incompatibility domain-containing protein n=1 Tax=Cephalotrichum gorgonifer TaxID=2041049 RepID=A0AAE8MVL5_9PEZI|nr:uncharacterized protein DNG_04208 [Cephalotrichum gorgonifer]